ncbi:MAG: hypothetical protein K9L21_01925, partial [Spirochaetia bacterium]|nr:hypothetical protein [Spirochaetia bacterium]
MNTKIASISILILISTLFCLPAISQPYNTIPIDDPVYALLENLELRGLIPPLSGVKPYTRTFAAAQLESVLASNDLTAGEQETLYFYINRFSSPGGNSAEAILQRGSVEVLSTVSEDSVTGIAPVRMGPVEMGPVEIGITLESLLSFPLLDMKAYDSRNAFSGYVRGDISTISSFNIELGLRYDLLNIQAWPRYAFSTPGEGQYIVYSEEGNVDSRGQENFAFNFLTEPELTVSLLNDNLQLRWGMFRRDWGSGVGNLIISNTARSFDAIEGKLALADWLTYQYLTGTLTAPKILASVGGYGRPDQYQNMLTTKRLQFDLPHRISFSVFETVMWPKRFELGYLNPFMISTIYQNTLGDYDNMFAGFDFSLGFF